MSGGVESAHQGTGQILDLQAFFDRPMRAWRMLHSRNGAVVRRCSAWIEPHWDGPRGGLHEGFIHDDGTESARDWFLTQTDNPAWHGEAGDVVGGATMSYRREFATRTRPPMQADE